MMYGKKLLITLLVSAVVLGGASGCGAAENENTKSSSDITLGKITSIDSSTVQLALVAEDDGAFVKGMEDSGQTDNALPPERPEGNDVVQEKPEERPLDQLVPGDEAAPPDAAVQPGGMPPSRYKETGDSITFNLSEQTKVIITRGAEEQETETTNLCVGDVIEVKIDSSGNAADILILEEAPRSEKTDTET